MSPPQLNPGQVSGMLAQATTGVVLNKDGGTFLSNVGRDHDYFIFDSLAQARDTAAALIEEIGDAEFWIYGAAGEMLERIDPAPQRLAQVRAQQAMARNSRPQFLQRLFGFLRRTNTGGRRE